MEVEDVSPALQHRLGPEGTVALVELFDQARQEWTVDVTSAAVERFERRLSDELNATRTEMRAADASLREEIRAVDANLRVEIRAVDANLRAEIRAVDASLRAEIRAVDTNLRLEMTRGFASVREDMGTLKVDLLKWNFAFWASQIIAVATIVGVMLRVMQT
jgi:hypothetical protein